MLVNMAWGRKYHNFNEKFNQGERLPQKVITKICSDLGASGIQRATEVEDREGTDWWLDIPGGSKLSVDTKYRPFDPLVKFGVDDFCIETTSIYTGPNDRNWKDEFRGQPGWTIDRNKKTGVVAYIVVDGPSRGEPLDDYRITYFDFPKLCEVANHNWRKWALESKERAAQNRSYLTLSVFVPLSVLPSEVFYLQP